MEDKLRDYVEGLFAGTALTRKAVELKEEMIQNLNDKYNDLIAEGRSPEASYNIAVAGIGDVSGLISELEHETITTFDIDRYESAKTRSAMLTAMAVTIYILSVLPLIILSTFSASAWKIGVPLMFIMVAGATGLLVYNNMTKPKIRKGSDTIVEEFREWQTGAHDRKALRRSISAAMWSLITVLYFIVSFWTGAWHVTWIVFLIGAAIEAIINVFLALRK